MQRIFSHRMRRVLALLAVATIVASLTPGIGTAKSKENPTLHNVKYGDKLPAISAQNIRNGKKQTIKLANGKPSVIMFFSIKPAFRKKRSMALLSALSSLAETYKNKVTFIGIYSDKKNTKAVAKYIKSSANKVHVFADPSKKIYDTYGVFMMPLVVIGNADGKLHEVIPYTYNIRQLIDGNLKLLLGEWNKEEFQESLKPKQLSAKSETEKEYIRRINYGRIMQSKKMYSQAAREFSTAVKLMPDSIEGWLELGFAQMALKSYDKAEKTFKKAQAIDPESDDAIAGLGLVYYEKGDLARAKQELENAFIAPKPRLEVIIALATIYEQEGNNVKANRLNKLAISRLMTMYEQRWK